MSSSQQVVRGVKRYSVTAWDGDPMGEEPDGEYVRYEDYKSLRVERDALVSLLTRYRSAPKFGDHKEMQRTIAIEDEIDALLAKRQANEQEQA